MPNTVRLGGYGDYEPNAKTRAPLATFLVHLLDVTCIIDTEVKELSRM